MPVPFRASRRPSLLALLAVLATLAVPATASAAQAAVGLGTAGSYAVLAGSAVTNTGPTILDGDLGASPTPAISGFPPGIVNGTTHAADAAAAQAQADLTIAYDDAAGRGPALNVAGDLGGLTVTGGTYRSATSLGLTGTLTLDGQGDPDSVFVFQAGSTLTTATASRVRLINGAQSCNVFWQVGSSASLGTSSTFVGNVLALTSVSVNDGVTIAGRLLARNGAVTLINDRITPGNCATGTGGDDGGTGGTGGTTGGGVSRGTAILATNPASISRTIARYGASRCIDRGFRTFIRGLAVRRVVFTMGGKVIATRRSAPFAINVPRAAGMRVLRARVSFSNGAAPVTLTMRFRTCASRVASPSRRPVTPPGFAG
ncbi:MAG: hypothetical protein JWO69_596 [Thermoleophilia bacterium]|jgi:hypothetical protein|nr:hypothetical protein [Thermoleophilia bacterium]